LANASQCVTFMHQLWQWQSTTGNIAQCLYSLMMYGQGQCMSMRASVGRIVVHNAWARCACPGGRRLHTDPISQTRQVCLSSAHIITPNAATAEVAEFLMIWRRAKRSDESTHPVAPLELDGCCRLVCSLKRKAKVANMTSNNPSFNFGSSEVPPACSCII
jgi:hypothetical protein